MSLGRWTWLRRWGMTWLRRWVGLGWVGQVDLVMSLGVDLVTSLGWVGQVDLVTSLGDDLVTSLGDCFALL